MEVNDETAPKPLILLTGSTGYIGGRLKPLLESFGYPLRCPVRDPSSIPEKHVKTTQYVVADLTNAKEANALFEGVDIAYYLIHSMGGKEDFAKVDRALAVSFAEAAARCRVKKILYLGGLGSNYEDELSSHLKSRHEVGHLLRTYAEGVQVIEFRASIVIGSGSLSFEMIRALVNRLPFMITPEWVRTEAQPIAIEDLLRYLVEAVDCKFEGDPILEIGGRDKTTYEGLMREYARQKGLKRWMIPVPFLSPKLSSLWLGLVTPLYARVGKKLVESALCKTTVHDPLASHYFHFKTMGVKEAIRRAIENENNKSPLTRWNDAYSSGKSKEIVRKEDFGDRIEDLRERFVPVTQEVAFRPIEEIGGERGYYAFNFLWWIRGLIDLLVGGIGLRRGRRDPRQLRRGDVVDFWRVAEYEKNRRLLLQAEMKLPGKAWLEFTVQGEPNGSKISQKAIFVPIGVFGVLYWYFLSPIHHLVFSKMLDGIVNQIEVKR